ncbi:MAG: ABC transporter permease [Treponema sp.]|nr:ABC transporter permease [Treponema sp.]
MRKLQAVIIKEFKATAANKTFVIITLLGPFLILAITVLPNLLTSNPNMNKPNKPVAIYTSVNEIYEQIAQALDNQAIPPIRITDLSEGKSKVLSEQYAGILEIPEAWPREEARFYSSTGMEAMLYSMINEMLNALAMEWNSKELGLKQDTIRVLLSKPDFRVVKLGKDMKEETKTNEDFLGILFTVLSFVMMIYMTVLLYGQLIGRSVVQEKTSKTVEIMLSSLSARELMFGKILGLGIAGLIQYGVWFGMGIALITLVGPALHVQLPQAITVSNFIWLIVFFILAFFLYGACYAALGAAAEDEHHLGQLAWPLIIFLVIPMVMISPMIMNPKSLFVVILSYFPMTAPIVMLVRILVSMPPVWEITLSLGIILCSVIGSGFLGAKIFRVGILMYGKRPKFDEVLRWIRIK